MYKKGTGNDKQGKDAGNRTLCPYRNFSQAISIFTKGSCVWEYCCLSLCFSLTSASDSSETGWLSGHLLLEVGMALSTAVLIAVTIKSTYLSRSWVDLISSRTSPELSAAPRVLSVSLNLYLMGSVCLFLWCWASIEISMFRWEGDRCPSRRHLLEIVCHVWLSLVISIPYLRCLLTKIQSEYRENEHLLVGKQYKGIKQLLSRHKQSKEPKM